MEKELAVLEAEIQLAKTKHSKTVTQAQIRLRSIVASIHERKVLIIKAQEISCVFCERNSQIRFWEFIQMHLYLSPRGYIEKEQWVLKGIRTCTIVCPNCSHKNSIDTHHQKDKIVTLVNSYGVSPKEIFGRIWNLYGNAPIDYVFPAT